MLGGYGAIDKALHDNLVEEGMALLEQDNTDELVRVIGQLYHNQIRIGADAPCLGLASIMRA